MSHTTTYKLFRTKVTEIGEHRNGWGSGPLVWDYLEEKYLPKLEYSRMILGGDKMREVWGLASDDRLAKHEKVALVATFDWSYCPTHRLTYAAEMLKRFYEESSSVMPDRANHWSSIADDYIAAGKDKRMLGVCISCTSVNDIWWGHPRNTTREPWPYMKENNDV